MNFEANRSYNKQEKIIHDVFKSEIINLKINRLLECIFKTDLKKIYLHQLNPPHEENRPPTLIFSNGFQNLISGLFYKNFGNHLLLKCRCVFKTNRRILSFQPYKNIFCSFHITGDIKPKTFFFKHPVGPTFVQATLVLFLDYKTFCSKIWEPKLFLLKIYSRGPEFF